MYPTFEGKICGGKLMVPELERRIKILEGKHLAIVALEIDEKNRVIGGSVLAGIYENNALTTVKGRVDIFRELEGKPVLVVVRHELMGTITPEVFDKKFQLGTKSSDIDT